MIIGICGKSGSGKSSLASKLINIYGNKAIHLDIDKIGHKSLTSDCIKEKLVNCFGNQILKDNLIDRKSLSKIVFNSKEEMNKLTDITWNYMKDEIDKTILDNKNKIIILDWLLLPKSEHFNKCDLKILLDIPYHIREKRAITRDNITKENFKLREKASYQYDKTKFDLILKDNTEQEYKKVVDLI